MKHLLSYETRSAEPIETRDDDDQLAAATQAVEELRTSVEQHRTATDTRITNELRTISERLDTIDVRTQRPGAGQERSDETNALERRAFLGFVRHGREALGAEEVRA